MTVTVNPVPEGPVLGGATSATVTEGGAVTLGATDTIFDSGDTLGTVTVTGLPHDLTNGNGGNYDPTHGTWTGTAAEFNALSFNAGETTGIFNLSVSATTTGAEAGTTTGSYTLTINPAAEGPVLGGTTSATVTEGGAVTLGATDAIFDSDDTLGTVTVSGLPVDLTDVNGGTYDAVHGTWTGTAAQFNALSFNAGQTTGTFNLSVSAMTTGTEAGTTTGSYTLTVNAGANGAPVINAPALKTVGVNEAMAISGVSLSESGNTDGETFTVTLTDTHGDLSANTNGAGGGGTINGSGTTTLTISGTLNQVNSDLSTLADTDGTAGSDTITLNATDSLGNSAMQKSIAVTAIQPAPLWGEVHNPAQPTSGTYLTGGGISPDPFEGAFGFSYSQIAGFVPGNSGPYTLSQYFVPEDPFLLPENNAQLIASPTLTVPARGSNFIVNVSNGSGGVQPEGIVFYQAQDNNGNHILDEALITGSSGSNALNVTTLTNIENFGTDKVYNLKVGVLSNTANTPINLFSNYAIAWDQYNAQTQSYIVNLQAFSANGSVLSSVTQIPNLAASGLSGGASATAWQFQSVQGTVNEYVLGEAQHNSATGFDYLNFQSYTTSGVTDSKVQFQIQSDLTHYATGATNHITQELIPSLSASPGGGASALQFGQFGNGNYFVGWNETVQDTNGTHDQVEFAEFKPGTGVVSQSTFQIADGQAQNIRTLGLPGNNVLLLMATTPRPILSSSARARPRLHH